MKLGYLLLYVADVEESLSFYETVFGFSRRFINIDGQMGYAELETGSTRLGFVSHALAKSNGVEFAEAQSDSAAPPMEVGLVTEDVASAYESAVAKGAQAVAEPKQKPWGQTVAYVRDLNGFLVELCSPLPE